MRWARLGDLPALDVHAELAALLREVSTGELVLNDDEYEEQRDEPEGLATAFDSLGGRREGFRVDLTERVARGPARMSMEQFINAIVGVFATGDLGVDAEQVERYLRAELTYRRPPRDVEHRVRDWLRQRGPRDTAYAMVSALVGVSRDRLAVVADALGTEGGVADDVDPLESDLQVVDYVLEVLGFGADDRAAVRRVLSPLDEPETAPSAVPVPPAPPPLPGAPKYVGSPGGPPSSQMAGEVRGPDEDGPCEARGDDDE